MGTLRPIDNNLNTKLPESGLAAISNNTYQLRQYTHTLAGFFDWIFYPSFVASDQ